uniref:Uncharacterized protein n=1 Tax=Arundo donax TaxID=35708 RepID=A0A0A8ZLF3_ARUDO
MVPLYLMHQMWIRIH